ncbi:S-methyl thiohydantoin desulfurase domain-containing protein [Aliamphritea hakodatensis]|uniref:S-methyl thiohydantoin desulfurase domain-containing protein n=1 Tax=Aliamphritea hakodatensis TaxID=2895352 RepID=UPI0022FD4090|nr:DUF917 family protein [Aliamphritea hakodatensis]
MEDVRYFSFQDLEDILRGAHFYASGGGGAYENGKQLLEQTVDILHQQGLSGLAYLEPGKNIPDDIRCPFVGALGAPAKYLSEGFEHAPLRALRLHEDALGQQLGDPDLRFAAVSAVETGTIAYGMNMLLAAQQGIPMIDADGCGRAVPVIPMLGLAQPVAAAPPLSPIALVSEQDELEGGAQLVINTRNTHNLSDMLHGIITYDDGFDQRSAFSCYAATGASLNSASPGFIVPGAMSRCLQFGRTLRAHKASEQAMVKAVADLTGGIHLGRLRLLGLDEETRDGFDYLQVELLDDRGNRYRVQVENESLLVLREDLYGQWQPVAMAPDLICYLCSNGDTITNAELAAAQAECAKQGKPLMLNLFVVPVPEELNTAHFRQLCMDELAAIGWPQSKIVSPFADYPETGNRASEDAVSGVIGQPVSPDLVSEQGALL